MTRPSMKTYLALLWGMSVWFAMASISVSIPDTSSVNPTAEPDKTTEQPLSPHVARDETETRPAGVSAAAAVTTTASATAKIEEAVVTDSKDSSLVAVTTAAATTNSPGPRSLPASTAAGEARPSHGAAISGTVTPTEDRLHQQSSTTFTATTAPATTSAAPAATSSPQPASTAKPEVTPMLLSTTSPAHSTRAPVPIQNLTSPNASTRTTTPATPTPELNSTSAPVTTSDTSTTSTKVPSTSHSVPLARTHMSTSQLPDAAGSSSTAEAPTTIDVAISTTNATASTSPAAVLIPREPKKLPTPTTKSTPTTTAAPCEDSKSPPSSEIKPCSARGLVKPCLIAIASLAGLATIFMVTTIILCTKLSTRKYKVKRPQPATEMTCISALLPETNYTYSRQRNPVSNGILVIHGGGDSDEDGGDNLTLSSFLPENDRFV